jgi:hypothetical protein
MPWFLGSIVIPAYQYVLDSIALAGLQSEKATQENPYMVIKARSELDGLPILFLAFF